MAPPRSPAPSGEATPATAPAPAPLPAPLTGTAAWDALRGNTINGSTPDGAYIEYFSRGRNRGACRSRRQGHSGQWKLREPTVCFTYPDDDAEDCRTFEVAGTKGTFIDVDGSRYHFDIVAGNPNHL